MSVILENMERKTSLIIVAVSDEATEDDLNLAKENAESYYEAHLNAHNKEEYSPAQAGEHISMLAFHLRKHLGEHCLDMLQRPVVLCNAARVMTGLTAGDIVP